MRVAIAIGMAFVMGAVGVGMLRSLAGRRPHEALDEPEAVPADVRLTYWCENCGTELLLLRKGSDAPPRHCGESMVKREEVARG